MKITPEAGKPYIASYFAGQTGEKLVDIQECRRFVGRIQGILYDGKYVHYSNLSKAPNFPSFSHLTFFVAVQYRFTKETSSALRE